MRAVLSLLLLSTVASSVFAVCAFEPGKTYRLRPFCALRTNTTPPKPGKPDSVKLRGFYVMPPAAVDKTKANATPAQKQEKYERHALLKIVYKGESSRRNRQNQLKPSFTTTCPGSKKDITKIEFDYKQRTKAPAAPAIKITVTKGAVANTCTFAIDTNKFIITKQAGGAFDLKCDGSPIPTGSICDSPTDTKFTMTKLKKNHGFIFTKAVKTGSSTAQSAGRIANIYITSTIFCARILNSPLTEQTC